MVAGRMPKSLVANLEQIYIQKIIRSKFFCRKMQKNFFLQKKIVFLRILMTHLSKKIHIFANWNQQICIPYKNDALSVKVQTYI